ncbi:MAG: hypothetical protein LBH79_08145 [Nitrososphaerota archaeon]|jgi:hypothetical protein|nr:hypothetical protein [Nitrososphaerota archaeon]
MTKMTEFELELFGRCANILSISKYYPERVFCRWHYDWTTCDGTQCSKEKRATMVILEW